MAIARVQTATGTSTTATTTASFSVAPTSGNLVTLHLATDDYNGTPNSPATQSTGMEQQTFHGGYLWWYVSTGSNSFQYTIGSASRSRWILQEWSGVHATPYDVSNGTLTQASVNSQATPTITPTAGDRLILASWGASFTGGFTGWSGTVSNSFTGLVHSAGAEIDAVSSAYLLVTANGSTGYTSTFTQTAAITPQSWSGLIIAFKAAAGGGVSVNVTTNVMTAGTSAPSSVNGKANVYPTTNLTTASVDTVTVSTPTGAAPAFRSVSTVAYASRGDTTVTKPTGTAENDILIASLIMFRTVQTTAPVVPSGWTQIGSYVLDGPFVNNYRRYGIWWKRATASEPADYTWGQFETANTQGTIQAFSGGILSGNPVDVFSSNSGTVSTATGTGITTTVANTKLLFVAQNFDASTTLTPPTGMTERYDSLTYLSDETRASAGATSDRTQTQASANAWSVFMLALKPEAGGAVSVNVNVTTNVATASVDTVTVSIPAFSPPVFRSVSSVSHASHTDIVVSKPTGTVEYDVMIAGVTLTGVGVDDYVVPPSGWTLLDAYEYNWTGSVYQKGFVYWRRAGASEPSNYTFTNLGTFSSSVSIQSWSSVGRSGNPVITHGWDYGTSTTPTYGGLTPSIPDTRLLWINSMSVSGVSPPSGMTERLDGAYTYLADEAWPTGSYTGTRSQGPLTSTRWGVFLMALKPHDTSGSVSVSVDVTAPAMTAVVGNLPIQVTGNFVTASVGNASVITPIFVVVTDAMTASVGDASVATPTFVIVTDAMTASVGDVTVARGVRVILPSGLPTAVYLPGVTVQPKAQISVTGNVAIAHVGQVEGSTGHLVLGYQYAFGAPMGGGYAIDEQSRDYLVGGTYLAKPVTRPDAYVRLNSVNLILNSSVRSVSLITEQNGFPVTGLEMSAQVGFLDWTLPTPAFKAVSVTPYGDHVDFTTVTRPDPVAAGDMLIAATFLGRSVDPGEVTPPSGFVPIGVSTVVSQGGFHGRLHAFLKIAGTSEPVGYDFFHTGTAVTQVAMQSWSGIFNPGNPVDFVSKASGTGTTSTATAVTTSVKNDAIIWVGHCWAGAGATPPAGWNERFDFVLTLNDLIGGKATAGSSGSVISTPNGNALGSDPWQAWLIALKPAQNVDPGDVFVDVVGNEAVAITDGVEVDSGTTSVPSLRSMTSISYGSRTNTTVTKPAGVQTGDILLVGMFFGKTVSDPGDSAVTLPTGWRADIPSTPNPYIGGNFYARFQVLWKRATSSEPASYTFIHAPMSTQMVMLAYDEVIDTGSPLNAISTAGGYGFTSSAGSITTTDNNSLLVMLGHNWAGSSNAEPPSGWTQRFESIVTVYENPWLTAGATGSVSHVPNGNDSATYPWQSWLVALKPYGTGDFSHDATAQGMVASVGNVIVEHDVQFHITGPDQMVMSGGIANVQINGGMDIHVTNEPAMPPWVPLVASTTTSRIDTGEIVLVQKAKGTSLSKTTTVSFAAPPVINSIVVLEFAAGDQNIRPDTGWNQSAGMEQPTFHVGYLWWQAADGVTKDFQYTIESAQPSSWVLSEFSNVDPFSPYDGSAGQIGETSAYGMTTPAIVPTSGNRLFVAGINATTNNDLTNTTTVDWLNGFTVVDNSGSGSATSNNIASMAYRVESVDGSTSYSTGARFYPDTATYKQSGLIIAFKKRVIRVFVTCEPMTAETSAVDHITDQHLLQVGLEMEPVVGGFSVTDGVSVNVRLDRMTAVTGMSSVIVPMYDAWDASTVTGGTLTNEERTLNAQSAEATALSWERREDGLWYAEVTIEGSNPTGTLGVYEPSLDIGTRLVLETGQVWQNPANSFVNVFDPIVSGDVVGIAYDADKGKVWFRINGGLWNNDIDQSPDEYDWPGSHNTGYKNAPGYPGFLTPYISDEGSNIIRFGPQHFEFMYFEGCTILAPGCTFYGCRFASNWVDGWNTKVLIDIDLYPEGGVVFQWCTFSPLPGKDTIPNPAWPSAAAGLPIDGVDEEAYTPFQTPYEDAYAFGIYHASGAMLVENCDFYGGGIPCSMFGSLPKIFRRCWLHDNANPGAHLWAGGGGYHSNGISHTDNVGTSNLTIENCTIASLGNTNCIGMQTGRPYGYQDIMIRHNYLSGFGILLDIGHNQFDINERLHYINNVIATDIRWSFGPIYGGDSSPQFRKPGSTWSGNILRVMPGTSRGPNSYFNFTQADDGKFFLPDSTVSDTDWVP